jgi:hypothetical protein
MTEAEYCVPKKKTRSIPVYDGDGESSGGMNAVWDAYNSAQDTMNRCRRVITANAALFNAQQRLRERLAEFHGVSVGDVW